MGCTGNVRQTTKQVSEDFDFYEQSEQMAEYCDHYVVEHIGGRIGSIQLVNSRVLYEGDSQGKITENTL